MSFPVTNQSIIPEKIQQVWDKINIGTSRVPIDSKYGHVERVSDDSQYKNTDYRDTISPLWNTLYGELDNLVSANKCINTGDVDEEFVRKAYEVQLSNVNSHHQAQVNVALCASIIQMGKSINRVSGGSRTDNVADTYTINLGYIFQIIFILL